MNPRPAQLQPAALLGGRIVCTGITCRGLVAVPAYYLTPAGICVECAEAMRATRCGRQADAETGDAATDAATQLGDYFTRLARAGLTVGDINALAEFYDGATCAEIAAAMDLTECAVKKRLERAREKLAAAGLAIPDRPHAPAVQNWSNETLALLEQSVAGRWRLRRRPRVARRNPERED